LNLGELIFKIKEIMTTEFIKIDSSETIREISDKMDRKYRDEVLLQIK
jgi:CBS domain-containing protein